MTGRFGWVLPVVTLVLAAGCGAGAQPGGLPSAPGTSRPSISPSASESLTPPVAVTTGTPEEQAAAQAKLFISRALPAAYAAAATQRRTILQPFAIEPALRTYLTTMTDLDKQGRVRRGATTIISQTVERSGNTALVRMCGNTDTSHIFDKSTGQRLTKAGMREIILITLKLTGSVWKVSGTDPTDQKC